MELLDKTKLEVVAYNERADFCVRKIEKGNIVLINGKIICDLVEIIDIDISS